MYTMKAVLLDKITDGKNIRNAVGGRKRPNRELEKNWRSVLQGQSENFWIGHNWKDRVLPCLSTML